MLECVKNGREFMYVRRRHRMITKRKMNKLFEDMEDVCIRELGGLILYDGQGSFYLKTEDGKKVVGYCTSIEDAYFDKGIPFNKVQIILFDEFIDYDYMKDELEMFRHTIANIVRDEEHQGVRIIMLGNTVSKYCPYFDYFGININRIKQGNIAVVKSERGGTAAFEYTKSRVVELDGKKKSKYFGFDGANSEMILHGEWEYNSCKTERIDDCTWATKRNLIRAYITGIQNTYEMSYTLNKGNPVAFVRCPNTQRGVVSKNIKYNISFDNSIKLVTFDGKVIPTYNKISPFMDSQIVGELDLIKKCVECGRVLFENEKVGTEFMTAFKGVA